MDDIILNTINKKQSKNYFTQETEDAIVLYNQTKDSALRNKIYEKHIHYAFFKLTQNIIHTFKFRHTDVDNLEHLQQELIVFLLTKIHLFNPALGSKAYSYFGTCVKRWLIVYNTKNYNKLINNVSLESLTDMSNRDSLNFNTNSNSLKSGLDKITEEFNYDNFSNPDNDYLIIFMDLYINYCYSNLENIFPRKNDIKIADAILDLFKQRNNISIFNKKALYLNIRERVEAKTPKITQISDTLYKIFKSNYIEFLNSGEDPFKK